MAPVDFIIWLKGFLQASSNFTLTPKQFDDLKEQLDKVEISKLDEPKKWTRYTLDESNWGINTTNNIKND